MLNKTKKKILPMLDTLAEALTQYLELPAEGLFDGIIGFIDAINALLADESKEALEISEWLKASLKNPVISEIERLYNQYYTVVENIPVQYKVVFLPYYDNTWDSLASVYEAFASDPMFVTDIVIIPIMRNTITGWKIIYKDYLTPKGIPNTHFLAYNFEDDLPDLVFYSNPYDGVNIEKFQSYNIKPYAGCMVYVPYFLYQHMLQDKEGLKNEIDRLTQLSGHDNSDMFIAQGQSFFKTFAHRSRNGKKMVTLGNPKTDNIYRHMKDYPRYPEWDKATEGKTVFLLNTHFTDATLGYHKAFLPYLLEYIEQNDDLALIWRPHPQSFLLLEEDDQSEDFLEWQSCLEHVSNHERMILDQTESDISAIMYSDAVLSRLSSVVAESIFADKPVFLLGWNPKEMVPNDIWLNMTIEDYMKKLKQIRKYDVKNLFLFSAVCYRGLTNTIPRKEDITNEYWKKTPMLEFIDDIRNGIDSKRELRSIFREQLFVNRDGTCGQKIHDYIVGLIKA